MERDDGGLAPDEPPQQNKDTVSDKPSKIFMTDDEGIGGSENNTPRPGSAMGESRPPASTTATADHRLSPPTHPPAESLQPQSESSTSSQLTETSPDVSAASPPQTQSAQPNGLSDGAEIDAVAQFNNYQQAADVNHGHGALADDANVLSNNESQDPVSETRSSVEPSQPNGPGPVDNHVTSAAKPAESPPWVSQKDNAKHQVSKQLQQAVQALQDYQARLRQGGTDPGPQQDESLKQTLDRVTSLCQACSATSATLGHHLQQARQLTDSISQDLSHRLQTTDLKDWVPPGYCEAEGEKLPEERQAAERQRLARAAEARAAVARASHAMQTKTQELAQAEADMVEAELAAAAAKEVAEEAVLQLEATKAAQEARQRQEEEEKEAAAREEEVRENNLIEASEKVDDSTQLENTDQKQTEAEQEEENPLQDDLHPQQQETVDSQQDEETIQPQAEEDTGKTEQEQDTQHSQDNLTQDEQNEPQAENLTTLTQENESSENAPQTPEQEDGLEQHIEFTDGQNTELQREDSLEQHIAFAEPQESELTSQKVFQVVHENHNHVSENEEPFDPDSWPRFIYSLDPGDWDTGLGCVIRSGSRSLGRDDLEVTRVQPASAALPLHDSEELISNIVCVTSAARDGGTLKCSPFLSVCLPHCAPRLHPGREPAVRMRPKKGGGWRDLPTSDVSFDDIKEHKFVECRLHELGTLCVVLRLKRETVQLTRHGGKVMASADSRVTLTWPYAAVKSPTNVNMAVQLLDQNVVTELRTRDDVDCVHLMSSSPVLHCQSQAGPLLKPVTVSLPCPPNPAARPQRPASSVPRKPPERVDVGNETAQRPATARPLITVTKKTEEVYQDEVHVLWRRDGGGWRKLSEVEFQVSKKKDIVIFELHQFVPRLLLLRTRTGLSQSVIERTASTLEHMLAHHPVNLVLRQHHRDLTQVILTYTSAPNMERTLRALAEEGYSQGPALTSEVKLREGQVLEIGFRGNLQPTEPNFVPRCAFHNNIPFRVTLTLTKIDRFAQNSFESYRGFIQLSTTYTPPALRRTNSSVSGMGGGPAPVSGAPACFVGGKHLLAELLASLPKPEPEPPKPLNTAPVNLKSYGPVTNDLLRHVAQQLAADDWRRLAPMLNVRRTRLQAIMRQNVGSPSWLPIYELLLTWSKKLPQAFDRVDVLCAALIAVGRNDLVEEVRDREISFRKEHAISAREALLQKAFIRIARHEKAVAQWHRLALFLGLSQEQVKDITSSTCSARERCIQSLQQWQDSQDKLGEAATVTLLSHKLRLCRYRVLAREIESIR